MGMELQRAGVSLPEQSIFNYLYLLNICALFYILTITVTYIAIHYNIIYIYIFENMF